LVITNPPQIGDVEKEISVRKKFLTRGNYSFETSQQAKACFLAVI